MNLKAEISPGELFDKISILEIKSKKIKDKDKLKYINQEKEDLYKIAESLSDYLPWIIQLQDINYKLWEVEDSIRYKEKRKEFDSEFISLARNVYIINDERFSLKSKINNHYSSNIIEQKSYISYNS